MQMKHGDVRGETWQFHNRKWQKQLFEEDDLPTVTCMPKTQALVPSISPLMSSLRIPNSDLSFSNQSFGRALVIMSASRSSNLQNSKMRNSCWTSSLMK